MEETALNGVRRVSHPQESWEWPIAVYLYLAGLGAGSFAVGTLTKWILNPSLESQSILSWGPLLVAAGAPFLILDLGRKMRFLNASLNPMSSWAARGFLILSILMLSGIAVFAASFLPWVMPMIGLQAPAWLDSNLPIFRGLEILAVVFSFGTAAYTGVFLKSTRYISLWNTWFLPLLFVISALSTGSMGIIVALLGFGEIGGAEAAITTAHTVMRVEQVLVIVEAIVLALFMLQRNRSGSAATLSVKMLALGRLRPIFWGGIVVLGMLFPVILETAYTRFPDVPALIFVGGGCLLTGGFFLRYAIVKGGIKSQHPLHEMAADQHDWRTLAGNSGDLTSDSASRDS